jgi:hypothetical protein
MQTLPVACRPLADWLGQSVRFQGYLNHWETANKTGDTAFLLRNIKVVPYKGCKEQMRMLDHIWIYLNQDAHAATKFERLGGYEAVGQVVSYIRSNGTRDFAIDIKPYVPIETHFELLQLHKAPKLDDIRTRKQLLEITLNLLEIEELNFSIHLVYKDVYQLFQSEYEFCQKQVEINDRYDAKKQYHPKSKTDVVNFGAAASKSTKVAGKGFATS